MVFWEASVALLEQRRELSEVRWDLPREPRGVRLAWALRLRLVLAPEVSRRARWFLLPPRPRLPPLPLLFLLPLLLLRRRVDWQGPFPPDRWWAPRLPPRRRFYRARWVARLRRRLHWEVPCLLVHW